MRVKDLGIAILSVVALVAVGFSQSSKGILAGVVRDQTGAVVAGAQVTVTNQQTQVSRTVDTSGNGAYRIEGIDPGPYTIHVSEAGFAPVDSKNLLVTASQVTSFDPTLTVGSNSATVEVDAISNTINTENGHLGGTVSEVALAKIPNFSLSPVALAAIVPGVSPVNQMLGLGGSGGNGQQIQVNGARPRSNNFMLDGQDINDIGIGGQAFQPALVDAFQQVTVLTNSTSAEFGRTGGAVVNSITKTGTNQFHGTVWDLYQGSGLNSQDGQSRQNAGTPKARFDEHSFGALVGGPIIRDKLFAFGGTQFQRFYGNSQASPIFLPDQASYNLIKAIGGPQATLLEQYLGNGTYLNTFSPSVSGQSYNISPRPGCPSGCTIDTVAWLRPPVPQQEPDTQWIVRVDYTPTSKDTFTYRYLHDNQSFTPDLSTNTSGLPEFDNTQGGPSELAQGGWTHVFSPNVINELRAGETRIRFEFAPLPATVNGPLGNAPNLNFSDNNGLGDLGIDQNLPQGRAEDLYQLQDTVGWTIGRQSLRIGVDLGRQIEKDIVSQNHFGNLTYSKSGTPTTPALSKLDNFFNDRIGGSGSASKSFGPTRIDPHAYKVAAFVQDDIKLRPDFTLNVGLRYDYTSPIENSLPYPALDTSNPFLPITAVIKVQPDRNNLGPRVGFSYAPSGNHWLENTSIRGGFGVFYDVDFSNIAINGAQSAPNSPTGTIVSTTKNPVDAPASTLLASITPNLTPFNSVLSVSSHLVNPLTYQYNFGIERTLPAAMKLGINYVGVRSLKLYANQQYNYFDANTGLRLNPNRGAVNARINDGVSNYNGVQVEVSRQFHHGLYLESNYVYSKLLDDSSEVFALFTSQTSYGAQLAPGKRGQEWGNSAFDHRHFFSIAYVYSPVGFRSGNALTNGLLSAFTRNFTFSGLTQLQSGSYSSFQINGLDTNGDGNPVNDRPLIGNPRAPLDTAGIDGAYVGGTPGSYYDMAIANTQTDSSGNPILKPVDVNSVHFLIPLGGAEITPRELRRNSFSNPGTTTWNFAVEKDVPVSRWTHLENSALQFRVEAQNVFNHNDVGVLGTDLLTIGTPAYMNTSAARDTRNRALHLWAKFAF